MPSQALSGAPLVTPPYRPAKDMVIDATQDDNDNPLYATDEFRMAYMKVLPCAKRFVHDWTTCPFSHPGEKARRRDPRTIQYTGIACPDMKKTGNCARGDRCPYAHQVFEYWLNYTRYRTQLCKDGPKCRRRVCFFAHAIEELRMPPIKPYVAPEYLAALAAETSGRKAHTSSTPDTPFGLPGSSPTSSLEAASSQPQSSQRSRSSHATSSGGDPRSRPPDPEPSPSQPLFAPGPAELQLLVSHLRAALKGPQRVDAIAIVSAMLKDAIQTDLEYSPSTEEATLKATAANVFSHMADACFDAPWPGPPTTLAEARAGAASHAAGFGQPLRSKLQGAPSLEAGLAEMLGPQAELQMLGPTEASRILGEDCPLLPPGELASAVAALAQQSWPGLITGTPRPTRHLTTPLPPPVDQAGPVLGAGLTASLPLAGRPTRRTLSLDQASGGIGIQSWQDANEISSALASMGMKGDLRRLTSVLQQASQTTRSEDVDSWSQGLQSRGASGPACSQGSLAGVAPESAPPCGRVGGSLDDATTRLALRQGPSNLFLARGLGSPPARSARGSLTLDSIQDQQEPGGSA